MKLTVAIMLSVIIITMVVAFGADSNADLKRRLADQAVEIETGKRERAQQAVELKRLKAAQQTQVVAAGKEAGAVAVEAGKSTVAVVESSAKAQDAAVFAQEAAASAKAAAEASRVQIQTLIIVQVSSIAVVILGMAATMFGKHFERAERLQVLQLDHQWKIETTEREGKIGSRIEVIHKLVNSNLTAAYRGELAAINSNIQMLQAALVTHPETAATTAEKISAATGRITELTAILADRDRQDRDNALQLKVDAKAAGVE